MHFKRTFIVDVPIQDVERFHRRPVSLSYLTPPPLQTKDLQAPSVLNQNDEISFRLSIGPLAIPWRARIEDSTERGFVDRQIRGPFHEWIHRHHYRALTPTRTEITDKIEWTLNKRVGWWIVGLLMTLGLPLLFAFRSWSTKQHLTREI